MPQGDSEDRQLGLFFFSEEDAQALIEKVTCSPVKAMPHRWSLKPTGV